MEFKCVEEERKVKCPKKNTKKLLGVMTPIQIARSDVNEIIGGMEYYKPVEEEETISEKIAIVCGIVWIVGIISLVISLIVRAVLKKKDGYNESKKKIWIRVWIIISTIAIVVCSIVEVLWIFWNYIV